MYFYENGIRCANTPERDPIVTRIVRLFDRVQLGATVLITPERVRTRIGASFW